MTIEHVDGAMVITGEHIRLYQLLALKYALKLEIKGLRGRGSAYRAVKQLLKIGGNKQQVLEQLETYIKEHYGAPHPEASE